jgi:hypothetical protein
MTRQTQLVNLIVDCMVDSSINLLDLRDELCAELKHRAETARKEADDYTAEELDYWHDVHDDVMKMSRTHTTAKGAIGDFLKALDSGYFGTGREVDIRDSEFLAALRNEVAMLSLVAARSEPSIVCMFWPRHSKWPSTNEIGVDA